jgi:3-deoxy-7-phosphoheptulonate synthase
MIVVMESAASDQAVECVISFLVSAGFDVHRSSGSSTTILGVVGDLSGNDVSVVSEFPGVSQVVRVSEPFRLASRRFRQQSTVIEGPWGSIGGDKPWIAIEAVGPVAVPVGSPAASGGSASSSGSGSSEPPPASKDLAYEVRAGRPFDAAVTRSPRAVDTIGALVCLSVHPQPSDQRFAVHFVERGPSWGANAWIGAAERELARGDSSIELLEAGGEYPNGARTLEIAAIARAKQRTHLPIVVDVPSIAQRARYVESVACAAIAAGADGVILRTWIGRAGEVPRVPATLSWSDAVKLAEKLRGIGQAIRG